MIEEVIRFPVLRIPWLPEPVKKVPGHIFGAVLLLWLYFWVDKY